MKKLLMFIFACLVSVWGSAQTLDAFKGIWPVTDRDMMHSLNGEWQLKVVKGVTDDKAVPMIDDSWRRIPVPGCWEPYGFCEPRYNYPDSLTGYYRTTFTIPQAWKGQQVIIRFDGVLRGYDLWLNDQYVGTWESGYNTCLFDLSPYLTKKAFKGEPQQLAMRVYSHFKGYEFDCFDDWATMGIFRDVTLMAVPKIHLADLTVTTKMNGEVTVTTEVANRTKNTTTDYEILDAQGNVVSTGAPISHPHLWTAETPYLYLLKVRVREKGKVLQTFTQKIGIREITVGSRSVSPFDSVKNVLKVNGQPVKLRGVNAHSTDPKTVKVIGDDLTLKDMRMMKEASVNYMRLSHYPREPRFFELADSLGFYLVDEVPFGFGDKYLSSRSYQDILKTRALATVTRDKNHPSVIVWSVGNENPLPQTCVEVGDYVGELDPSRPYCFPQKYLLPLENEQVKADIESKCIEGGEEITFTLMPDTADVFRSELGLAYLLDKSIDRVQWLGQGPFAGYPGRHQANRYGLWAKHKDDLYFEGNHEGIDAAFFSDKDGNGILIVGDSLNLNFEQTDRGIVLTVNAAVSGQGPKFAKTAFPGWKKGDMPVSATFRSYYIKADVMPQVMKRFFSPAAVPAPFKPFLTQYDTYLMKYNDIAAQRSANIVFIGNSITYGALHEQREQTAPPAQCARWLCQQEGIDTIYFRNCGRSGRTTYHFLPRAEDVVPAGDKTYFADVVAKTRELVKANPDLPLVFSIMLGTNDAVERKHNAHTEPEAYVRNLTVIIDSLLCLWPDAHVVLNRPIYNTSDYVTKNGSVASKKSLKMMNAYYRQFTTIVANCKAGHVHIGDAKAYKYFKKHYKTHVFEEKDARGQSYWLHPNEQGAEVLAQYWGKAILLTALPL